jgi:hypothetical protein
MARFAASFAVAQVLVCSRALRAASVALRLMSAVATTATAATMTAKAAARMLRGVLCDAALQWLIAGFALLHFWPFPALYLLAQI